MENKIMSNKYNNCVDEFDVQREEANLAESFFEDVLGGYQKQGYLFPEMWNLLKYYVEDNLEEFIDPKTKKEYDFFCSLIPFIRDAENAVLDRHGLKRIWPEEE